MRTRLALVVAILAGIATTTPAHAESVYAYWSYWQGDGGTWKYAVTGPATSPAVDGSVDGWRFTLGSDGKAAHPNLAADFASVCGSTEKTAGKARVAIIIDYGTAADAPPIAICSVIPAGLSRASALGAVATLRLNNGFICGINAIPTSGCGDEVAAPSPTAAPSEAASATASATPTKRPSAAATSAAPTPDSSEAATTEPTAVATPAAASSDPSPTDTAAAAAPQPTNSEPAPSSPIATVVSMVLAAIVLVLALRNAKRQRESA